MTEPKKRGRKPVKLAEKRVEPAKIVPKLVETYGIDNEVPSKPVFGVNEAAYQLGVSTGTIRLWIDHGKLGYEKIIGSIRIPRSEIIRLRIEGRRAAEDRYALR